MTVGCKFILLNIPLFVLNVYISVLAYEIDTPWYSLAVAFQIWTLTLIETPRYTVTTTRLTSKDVL